MKRLMLLAIVAAALAGCGQPSRPPAPGPELRAGDVVWICDINGENCECSAVGAAQCPEEAEQ